MKKKVTYEQPLNERVRGFLRLEYCFGIVDHYRLRDSPWDSRIAVLGLLEIIDLISRSDIKNDLTKELEKYTSTLDILKNNENVDSQRLNDILSRTRNLLCALRNNDFHPGQHLKNDDLVTSLKQRIAILGGTCNFDLPAFHHWLHQPVQSKYDDLEHWKRDLLVIQESVNIALFILRNSTTPVIEVAESGFFQQPIKSKLPCQLIGISLPADCHYFPEISGGKHRFTIRFMQQVSTLSRPIQTEHAVEFELHRCIL